MGTKKWSKKDISFFENLIKSKIVEVSNDLEDEKNRAEDIKTSTQSNAIYSSHMADASSDHLDMERAYYFVAREKKYLKYLHKALEMIDDGSFGICKECSDLISKDRLIEVPHTTKCFRCKSHS